MTAQRFRKKPVEVEAMRVPPRDDPLGWGELAGWLGIGRADFLVGYDYVLIRTLEGEMRGDVGDWIVKGTRGEFYPVKPEPFADTFEPVGKQIMVVDPVTLIPRPA